ncbi:alcohol dehydrogenase zinc-binding domain protein [Clostridium sartagoforme AAU1]|uniref:Alcohol dehydrogenase zinc-binding domain protein n=1 Tax=Clostridium sartagoforme AAU1 TaxID=1202534 RepID=R9BVG6_9CLOT|nr:alcohol dehydrogenase catalytic domain-containing protein [Clostridium sartagoforme]EOR21043.1 alcohol dehydrogenase zinc-binding domain protein [Clostridium sartagoforme AAU1]
MLRAVLYKEEDLRIEECPIPEIGPGDVLVKNEISTTCGTDVKIYKRGYPLLKPPHPFGHEFSGIIAAVGKDVNGFKEGDRVAVHNTAPCNQCYFCKKGLPSMCEDMLFNRGAYSEYVKVPERIVKQNMFLLDNSISYKTASLMEPFSCAVYGIDNCPIHPGDVIVVNGAGPIGLMFARLAVISGAKVIVTDMMDNRLKLASKLGVWKTVNVSGLEDSVEAIKALTDNNRGCDVVIEATGIIDVWEKSVKMARKGGFVLLFGGTKSNSILHVDATLLHYSQITIKGVFHTTPLHVMTALELLKMGVISSEDFIQNEYKLEDLELAIREHASGKVIKNCIVYP